MYNRFLRSIALRRSIQVIAIIVVFALLAPGLGQAPPTPKGTVKGTVKDADTSAPIGGAYLQLTSTSGSVVYADAYTDDKGKYIMRSVYPARYDLVATASGYVTQTREGITVYDGETTTENFALERCGFVTGTVIDEDTSQFVGEAIAYLVDTPFMAYSETHEGDWGHFNISGVAPGTYTLNVTRDDYEAYSHGTQVSVTAGETTSLGNIYVDQLPRVLPIEGEFDYNSAVWTGSEALIFGSDNTIVEYDPVEDTDVIVYSPFSSERSYTSSIWTGEFAYVFGGKYGTTALSEIVEYDPSDNTAVQRASLDYAVFGSSAVWTGTHAYLFGGFETSSAALSVIQRFDPSTYTVTTMTATLPEGRGYTSAVFDGEYAYVFGGGDGTADSTDEIVRYDPNTDSVDILFCKLPSERRHTAATWDGQYAYVFGGVESALAHFDDVVMFDPRNQSVCTMLRDLPEDMWGCSAIYDEQVHILFGGIAAPPGNVGSLSYSIVWHYTHSTLDDYGVNPQNLYVGGIVNAANGNLVIRETDIVVNARGFNIELTRTYNSLEHLDTDNHNVTCGRYGGVFGYGWTHNYNVSLREQENGVVIYKAACGSIHLFERDSVTQTYTSPPGFSSKLTQNASTGNLTMWHLDGSRENFNSDGRIANVTDKNGNMLTMVYDLYGRLTQVHDDAANNLTFTYTSPLVDRITTVTASDGRSVSYVYFSFSLIRVATQPRTQDTHYDYYLNSSVYPWAIQMAAIHEKVEPRYIPSLGYSTNVYDTTEFVYEEEGRGVLKEVWKSETLYDPEWTPFYPATCKYTFDYVNLTKTNVTCALGGVLEVEMNAEGFPIFIQGPPMVSSPTCGGSCASGVQYPGKAGNENLTLDWNADFRIAKSTDALGHSYVYEYDDYGNAVNITNPAGYSSLFEYEVIDEEDCYLSLLLNHTNPLGYTTSHAYDDRGNEVKTTDSLGYYTERMFDEFGMPLWLKDKAGSFSHFEFDVNGTLSEITDALGNVTEFSVDYSNYFPSALTVDALGNTYSTERTGLAWDTEKSYDPTGNYSLKKLNYREEMIEFADRSGNVTEYVNNVTLGKVDVVSNALGFNTTYRYNEMGFLISVIDGNGHMTNFTYDSFGRQKTATLPLGQVYENWYDGGGNMIRKEDPSGNSINYSYDNLNRLISIEYPNEAIVVRTYDAGGRLINISGPGSWKNTTYDALSRPTIIRTYIDFQDSQGSPLNYLAIEEIEYDANGNVIEDRIYDDYYEVVNYYDYDPLNRVSNMTTDTTDGDSFAWQFYYDPIGRCVNVNATYAELEPYYNTTYTYDSRSNLLTISVATDGVFTPYSHEYTYDSMSRLVEARDPQPGGVVTSYEYDEIGQLVGYVDDGLGTDLVYDSVGNQIEKTVELEGSTTSSYDANDRLESSSDGITYDYDENGNCIREYYYDGGELYDKTYTYDFGNRLIRVNSSSATLAIYNYSADGLLASSDSAWPTSTLVSYVHSYSHAFGLPQEVIRLKDGTDYDIMWWGPGVDQVLAIGLYDGGPHHTFVDGLGNTRHLINAEDGSLLGSQSYTPFGEMTESAWYRTPSFQGRFFDPATGLYDFRDRHYSAEIGRYTARPSDPKYGESAYLFPGNDPVNQRDPTGNPPFLLLKCTLAQRPGTAIYWPYHNWPGGWIEWWVHIVVTYPGGLDREEYWDGYTPPTGDKN